MGRRKIEIKRINEKDKRKVKRRDGLFGKAAELCKVCGAEITILTVSPGGKFYTFGDPDVDSIIARYCGDEGTTSFTVEVKHDCVSHEDDEEDLETGEQEKEVEVSSDEVDEQEGELEVSSDEFDEQERELEVSSDEVDEQERELEISNDEVDERVEIGSIGSSHKAGEENSITNNNIEEKKDLTDHINEEIDGSQKFWWDKEKPTDPKQVRMYYQSLMELRNNVAWVLNERNSRESYAKDYISLI